ncbi:MAG: DegV family protein [Clostridiales bacterium]|nr:DegV family protein [Clostridiales bacterium]
MFTLAKIKLFTDSSSDLTDELYQRFNISVVPFYVTFDKQTYYKERIDISIAEFYEKLRMKHSFPSTSLPSAGDYADAFRPYLEQGTDIVCLCISGKFSGSYQSAVTAAEELKSEFPDRAIRIVDSIQAACGQGVTLIQAARMIEDGLSADETVERIDELKQTARVFFTLDSLEYLQKGGRVGKVSALAGSLLNIKPIIVMQNAELNPVNKVRGRQKALERIIVLAEEYVGDKKDRYDYILINADCRDEVFSVLEKMKEKGFKIDWPIMDLGATIGSHTGPTLVGVCLIEKYKQ